MCRLLTLAWLSCKNTALLVHVMSHGVDCSILDGNTIFDNTIDGFSTEFGVDSSMESTWNPHGPAHGMSMEWSIPYGFHMDSKVGME